NCEVDQEQRPEEAREAEPCLLPRAVPERLEHGDDRAEPQRERDEQKVVERGRRELRPREVHERRRDDHSVSYSLPTVIRPTRWCVKVAPAQSTTALARSSLVGSSARCTAPHAAWAFLPVIVRPASICTTAAPRPIVAIVPLSRYLNGLASLPAIRRAIVSP